MRRKDREETSEEFFDEVFAEAEELFLAMNDVPAPYGVIVNFARQERYIYIHCAREGKKLDLIRADGHVSFCMACGVKIDPQRFTTYYKSVYGTGMATIVENDEEKCRALDMLAERYNARCPVPSDIKSANRVAIIKIEIESLTGKARKVGG